MNFRGSKVFDDHEEENYNNNIKAGNTEQRISFTKYVDRDPNANEENNDKNNRKYSNNKLDDDSFLDANTKNNNNSQQRNYNNNANNNNNSNNFNDKISLIKVLISNYLKEKELDM